MKALFPTRAIAVLLLIGMVDLISTAVLYHYGKIVEMNPVMRVFLERGEWAFVVAKGATLAISWYVLASYARQNRLFVRNACLFGSAAYLAVWLIWFHAAR